jgi:hypothetical protein
MDPKAIDKARGRLRIAQKALAELPTSKDFNEFNDAWYTFLTATKNIYTVLEQGAKVSPQSKQWFGARATQRRNDPLLQYLYQARDDDEHGLNPVLEGIGHVKVKAQGKGMNVKGAFGPGQTATFSSLDDAPLLVENNTFIRLATVTNRSHIKYAPPEEHLGQPLTDKSPLGVARAAIAHFTSLVEDASKL